MLDDTGNPLSAKERKLHWIVLIIEDVGVIFVGDRAVGMHTASVNTSEWFWHEGGEIAVLSGNEFDNLFEGLDVIAGL